MKCEFDPKTYAGQPIGMFHCPDCGELVLAGIDHPDYDDVGKKLDEYYDRKYKEFCKFLSDSIGEGFHGLITHMDNHQQVRNLLLDMYLRADWNEEHNCMRCNREIPGKLLYCSPFCSEAHEYDMTERTPGPESKL